MIMRWRRVGVVGATAGTILWIAALGPGSVVSGAGSAAGQAAVSKSGSIDGLEAKFVDVNGVRTRYYDYGQGEPMLLVHGGSIGGSSTANNFSRNIPGLAKRFRVLAVDRLAQGMTDGPKSDEDFTSNGQVEHIYQFIQTMKLGPTHLVGHSAGGGTVYYLALAHPEVARTLTIIAHHAGIPPGDGPTKFDAILDKCPPDRTSYEHLKCRLLALGHVPETFTAGYAAVDEYMGTRPRAIQDRKRMQAMRAKRPGWPDKENEAYKQEAWKKARAGALTIPILFYGGMQDTLSWDTDEPFAMMRSELGLFNILAGKNPKVQMIIINEAGHFPYREHPEQFDADLVQFIDFWKDRQ